PRCREAASSGTRRCAGYEPGCAHGHACSSPGDAGRAAPRRPSWPRSSPTSRAPCHLTARPDQPALVLQRHLIADRLSSAEDASEPTDGELHRCSVVVGLDFIGLDQLSVAAVLGAREISGMPGHGTTRMIMPLPAASEPVNHRSPSGPAAMWPI